MKLGILSIFLILSIVFGCSSDRAFKTGVIYTCDGGRSFELELFENVDIALLTVPERRFYLHRMSSASGIKYSDGSATLWMRGKNVSVEIEGRTEFENCSVKPK